MVVAAFFSAWCQAILPSKPEREVRNEDWSTHGMVVGGSGDIGVYGYQQANFCRCCLSSLLLPLAWNVTSHLGKTLGHASPLSGGFRDQIKNEFKLKILTFYYKILVQDELVQYTTVKCSRSWEIGVTILMAVRNWDTYIKCYMWYVRGCV